MGIIKYLPVCISPLAVRYVEYTSPLFVFGTLTGIRFDYNNTQELTITYDVLILCLLLYYITYLPRFLPLCFKNSI